MAEAFPLKEDWSVEVEMENPEGGVPQQAGWEDEEQRRAREAEANLETQDSVEDEILGGSHTTPETTEQLAVAQTQVRQRLHHTISGPDHSRRVS